MAKTKAETKKVKGSKNAKQTGANATKKEKPSKPKPIEGKGGPKIKKNDRKDDPRDEDVPVIFGEEIEPEGLRPIIFVPGIMGSRLGKVVRRNGRPFKIDYFWPPIVAQTKQQSLRVALDGLETQGDVVADGLFPQAYETLLSALRLAGYEDGKTLFVLPYDWRKSNRTSAQGLVALVQRVVQQTGWQKVDIVNHSMGGLVTREAHRTVGANIHKIVFIASPHFGASKAYFFLHPQIELNLYGGFFRELVAGHVLRRHFEVDDLEKELKGIVKKLPSVFELLPDRHYLDQSGLAGHVLVRDGNNHKGPVYTADETYLRHKWGLQHHQLDDEVRDALDFKEGLGTSAPGDPMMSLVIYCDALATNDRVHVDIANGQPVFTDIEDSGQRGDETVPTRSARDLGGDPTKFAVTGSHADLPNADATIVKLLEFLGVKGP